MRQKVVIVPRDEVASVEYGYVRDVYGSRHDVSSVQSAAFSPDGKEVVLVINGR